MPIETFAGKGISSTYQRVVQTDGTYLADGTGSLINNITIPGNLVVSGTLYAQNTVVVTQSFSSGSNILGDAADDFQTLYGTVRIPTGSLTVTGSTDISGSVTAKGVFVSTDVFPSGYGFVTVGSAAQSVGFHTNVWRGVYSGALFSYVANAYTSSVDNFILAGTRPANPTFPQFQLYVKTDNTTVFNLGGGGPILDIANNGTPYARFDGSNFSIGATSALSKLYISGSSSQTLLRIDSPVTSSIIYVSGSGVIGFNQTSSLTSQATFRGVLGSTNFTEINTTANGGYGLRTDGPIKANGYYFYNAGGGNILTAGGVSMMSFDSLLNVGIAVSSSIGARLHVRGAGTTSATTAFRVDNSNATASFVVRDDGFVGIGISNPGCRLDVSNDLRVGGTLHLATTGGYPGMIGFNRNVTTGAILNPTYGAYQLHNQGGNFAIEIYNSAGVYQTRHTIFNNGNIVLSGAPSPTDSGYKLDVSGSGRFTAGLSITGSAGTGSAVTIYKSGSTALDIQGSSGQLFAVTDSLTGSLFSVNTAAGLPTIEAFSDNTVNIGKFGSYPIKVVSLGTAAAVTGSFSGSIRATSITLTGSLNVSGSQNYVGDVNINGTLTATVKSFLIEHPTQPGKKLQYGNLEGPEHAVYFRGRSTSSIIELPEEWTGLVDEESITVQLTSIGKFQPLYVSNITSTRVEIQVSEPTLLNYHYLVHGERKDIDKLITTIN